MASGEAAAPAPPPSQYYPVKPRSPLLFRRAQGSLVLSITLPFSSIPLHFVYLFCTDVGLGLGLLSSRLLVGG